MSYSDWSRPTGPYPAWIDLEHVDELRNRTPFLLDDAYGRGPALFIRKIRDDASNVTDAIMQTVWPLWVE